MAKEWFKLSNGKIVFLVFYYAILLILGMYFSILVLLEPSSYGSISTTALVGGFSTSVLGCSFFYIRKLYKSCIKLHIQPPETDDDRTREIGVLSYFLLRPIFSLVFTILLFISIQSGTKFITINNAALDNGFVYTLMFFSFFTGFKAGTMINYIEKKGAKIIKEVFNEKN